MLWEEIARVLDGSRVQSTVASDGIVRLLKQQASLEAKVRTTELH